MLSRLSSTALCLCLTAGLTSAFLSSNDRVLSCRQHALVRKMAAESEVAFSDDLDGSSVRIGVLRTRWNDEHVSNLVDGVKAGAKECKVEEENIFVKKCPVPTSSPTRPNSSPCP